MELGLAKPVAILPFEEAKEVARRTPRVVVVKLRDGRGAVFELPPLFILPPRRP